MKRRTSDPEFLNIQRRLTWLRPPLGKDKIQWAVCFAGHDLKRFDSPELAQKYLQWTKTLPIEVLRNKVTKA